MGGTWSRCRGEPARLPAQAAKLAANRVAGVGVDPLRGAARGPPVPVPRRRPTSAALLSKSITLPAALLIWHWWKRGRVTWTGLLRIAPFFAVGGAIAVADLLFSRPSNAR